MSKQKPSIPSGTRDFSSSEVLKRNYIIDTIKQVYALFGYQPIETPVLENLSTLMGKYGEEGDKLLFKILNSGDFLKDADAQLLAEKNSNKILTSVSEKGLRYDLTVPFARYVVMHQNEITFPFKRFQIQPVWRADRPQKGRYREFYQCDADVIGSKSLLYDAEMVFMIAEVYSRLKISATIKLNNRKILDGLNEYIGETEKNNVLISILDKADKIGMDGVEKELSAHQFSSEQKEKITSVLSFQGTSFEKLQRIEQLFISEKGKQGIAELKQVFAYISTLSSEYINVEFDLSLARGLSYYTGTIYEALAKDVKIGSILGGGRYDDLSGIFGLPNMSGVGISFGLDRTYDVMTELNLFPENTLQGTEVLLIPFDADCETAAIKYAVQLRNEQISTEIYPDLQAKTGKKFKYADDKKIPVVLIIGSEELIRNTLSYKNMKTGEQQELEISDVIKLLKSELNTSFLDLSE